MQVEKRLRLAASGAVTEAGAFEILAITAGEGNGWQFPADCLRSSLPLWDGVETFVDHAWLGRSVRDLAGVCCKPEWDAAVQGIRLHLSPVGPSAPLLTALARQVLAEGDARPAVGFSADLVFTASGQQVEEILKVYSVDLVMDPARGGAFVRALNSLYSNPKEVDRMTVESKHQADETASEHFAMAQENEAVRTEMCRYLLDTALAASRLPAAMQRHVRAGFADRVFELAELQTAIEEARGLVSDLTASALVTGPGGQVSHMFSSEDRLQAAVDDLFGAPRGDSANVQVARLSGIRELYLMRPVTWRCTAGFPRTGALCHHERFHRAGQECDEQGGGRYMGRTGACRI